MSQRAALPALFTFSTARLTSDVQGCSTEEQARSPLSRFSKRFKEHQRPKSSWHWSALSTLDSDPLADLVLQLCHKFYLTYCPTYSDKTVRMHMVTSTGVKSTDNCSGCALAANLILLTDHSLLPSQWFLWNLEINSWDLVSSIKCEWNRSTGSTKLHKLKKAKDSKCGVQEVEKTGLGVLQRGLIYSEERSLVNPVPKRYRGNFLLHGNPHTTFPHRVFWRGKYMQQNCFRWEHCKIP